jgi:DNA repair protein RadA/Sms
MAKQRTNTIFLCNECGAESAKWLGKCPSCGAWNSLSEYTPPSVSTKSKVSAEPQKAVKLSEVDTSPVERIDTGIAEFNRVLGGGLVSGMTVLIGGDPGIGKSTLLMQAASELTKHHRVLYVTGEESASQLKLRASRLGASSELLIFAETNLETILAQAHDIRPDCLIIDSIQTISSENTAGICGNVSQIREATAQLLQFAKSTSTVLFIVGHVTKVGAIAGPRMLEHMVDTVLYFEGDRHDSFRILRAVKNRFGSTNEIGVFEMRDTGIFEVQDPSYLFVSSNSKLSGCAVTAAVEGTRPMLVEVQALLSDSPFNNPRRMATGIDSSRLILLLAVLEKKAGLQLYNKDVYLNAVGGIRLDDRASDLSVALAVASAYRDKPLPEKMAAMGEIGLTGELRPISRADIRINECVRLGYTNIILPTSYFGLTNMPRDIKPIFASTVKQAIDLVM